MGTNATRGPITDKCVFDNQSKDIKVGVCEMQGWRRTMEDASIALLNFDSNTSLFGIMDGHGGPMISKFVAYNLKEVLTKMESYKKQNYEQALIESFLKFDEYLRNDKVNRFLYQSSADCINNEQEGDSPVNKKAYLQSHGYLQYDGREIDLSKKTEDDDNDLPPFNIQVAREMGTTANIILQCNSSLYLANVGDSLSVMYKNGEAIKLNQEHKTTLKSEYERITKCGGQIINNRIEGKLNLTRAIGDLAFKNRSNLKFYEQSVTAYPEITKIKNTDDIEFIIMGCDGLWDCVEPQKLCENISQRIKEEPELPLSKIIADIFDQIISKTNNIPIGTDNMTSLIIQFLKKKR